MEAVTLHVHPVRPLRHVVPWLVSAGLALGTATGLAQTPEPTAGHAPSPAGADIPRPAPEAPKTEIRVISHRQAEAAEDAYLRGAKAITQKNLTLAERQFAEAVRLDPQRGEYALALAVTREHRLEELVQQAAKARLLGHQTEAEALLAEAQKIDPTNAVVAQHFGTRVEPDPEPPGVGSRYAAQAATLGGAPEFTPTPGRHSFHQRGSEADLINAVYRAWGITLQPDTALPMRASSLDVDDVDFETATHIVHQLTHTFAVPVDGKTGIVSPDTQDAREHLTPLVEETLLVPGMSADQLSELANLARNVFELRSVSTSGAAGALVLRGDEGTLKRLNATYADLIDGGADVLFDLTFYEIDTSKTRNIGLVQPGGISGFPLLSEAESLIAANQSVITAAVAAGLLTLTGNPATDALTELEFLIASGTVSSNQFGNLLGVFGHYGGLPLAGVFLTDTTTLNFSLNSSEVRLLDTVTVRAGDRQPATFRAGTRYPIETGIYSNGASSALTSAVAGLTVNGVSVSSLLGSASANVSVPQFQYEDLGLTLKTTPQVGRNDEIRLQLELKIEALGSGSINTLPILNSRSLTDTITVPAGRTALLVSQLSSSETKTFSGFPGLNEIPGFSGTNQDVEKDTGELLIAITPHIARPARMHITSRRLAMDRPPLHGQ